MRGVFPAAGLALCWLLSACVTETTVDRYVRVPESRVDLAYIRSGTDFSRYRKLKPAPLEIYYHKGEIQPDPANLERLRKIFREAFLAAIGDDYPIVDSAGPDVLGVRGSVVDLEESAQVGDMPIKGRAAALIAAGHLSFFMELSDSQTGQVLARAGDAEKDVQPVAAFDAQRDWGRAEKSAARWAKLFRDFLDENLGR